MACCGALLLPLNFDQARAGGVARHALAPLCGPMYVYIVYNYIYIDEKYLYAIYIYTYIQASCMAYLYVIIYIINIGIFLLL